MANHDNTGGLWKNKERNHKKAPDFIGQITVEGQTYYISAWANTDKSNRRPDLSIRVNQKALDKQYQHPPQGGKEKDDEPPF